MESNGPLISYDWRPQKRSKTTERGECHVKTDTQGQDCHVKMETEIGAMCLKAKDCWLSPEAR